MKPITDESKTKWKFKEEIVLLSTYGKIILVSENLSSFHTKKKYKYINLINQYYTINSNMVDAWPL